MDNCPKASEIDEMQEQLHAGDLRFQALTTEVGLVKATGDSTNGLVEDIHKRLFVDNGTKSFQTKVDRAENQIKWLWAAAGIIGLGFVGLGFAIFQASILPEG